MQFIPAEFDKYAALFRGAFWRPTCNERLSRGGVGGMRRLMADRLCGVVGLVLAAGCFICGASVANAQSEGIVALGDGVVTTFSNAKTETKVPKGVHPIDVTFIDPDGAALRVLDLSRLGGQADGQVAAVPDKLSIPARDIGQVFGLTFDSPDDGVAPNIYAAATSLFGLNIVGKRDGKLVRLVNGEAGAQWMPGQFAVEKGGGPGTLWKIDGRTGEVSLFSKIMSGPNDNAGPGLGGLAYDFVTRHLYVANLETGFIHRVDEDGKDLGFYDHGTQGRAKAGLEPVVYDATKRMSIEDPAFSVEKPETWGYAEVSRRVFAVAIQDDRLFYSVAEGPQVWSIGLDSAGGFADDARLEIDLSGAGSASMITAIAFDGPKNLYISQRGDVRGSYAYANFSESNSASVIHFSWNEKDEQWSNESEEFAIGLDPPHRSSNGGVAMGYGYDESGALDAKSCHATLWATGDNLSDNADGGRVSGLQAGSTASGQPRVKLRANSGSSALQGDLYLADATVLEAPKNSWFVDLDNGEKQSSAPGQIGAVAIHTPDCDRERAGETARPDPIEVDEPEIAWPDVGPDGFLPDGGPGWIPPVGFPGLDITKVCAPAAFGGVIQCTITVENTGTWPFLLPIKVTDSTTIAAGPGAGGAMQIAAVTPDGGDWTCTATPTINLTCGLPPEALPPGVKRSFTVDIDTSSMVADGNVGFVNCASLGAPYWGIACDNAGTDITVKKTAQAGCVAGANCTYTLEVTNNASSPFNGNVQLTDEMFRGALGPALNTPIVAINGDLGCAGGNPAAIPFSCLASLTLAAGETRAFDMTVTMPAAPPNYWARNCVAVTSPGLVPGDLPTVMPPGGGSLGSGGAVSCAWMQVGVPGPHANLKMKKTAQDCGKLPGDENTVKCDYTISISNTGPSVFNLPISFDETVDPAATLISNDAGWLCAGGPPTYACNSVAAVAIANGATVDIPVSVTTPRNVVEGNACVVPNGVALTAPPVNAATNYLGGDDTAAADGDAFLLEFDAGGAAVILCDPTNLRTTQTAKGPCEKLGAGWLCKFAVEVLNTGPDPYKGKLTMLDFLSIAPMSVSYSGTDGWSKAAAVGHDAYTLPQRTIAKGESVKLDLAVEIPDGPYCSLSNTAHMTFPVLKRHNGDKTDDTAVAKAMIPRPECRQVPQCKPKTGEIRTRSGACACGEGYRRADNGRCVTDERDPDPTPEPEPEPPEVTGEVCPDGYPIPRNGMCPCGAGKSWDRYQKACVSDDVDEEPPVIIVDDPVVPPLCKLLPGQIRTRDNRCVCANGRKWNRRTYCEPRTPPCKPRPGEIVVRGKCKCPNGRIWNAKTFCERPQQACPKKGTYEAAKGVCCPIGTIYRERKCILPHDPAKECKKKGWHWTGKRCVPPRDPAKECKEKGWNWTGYECLPPRDPANECKKKGWRWTGKRCIPPRDPAKECRKKGWNWTGKRCVPPRDPAKECKKKGWRWTGKRCVPPRDPATECKKKGWKWTGKKCVRPVKPCPRGTVGPGQPNCRKIVRPCPKGTVGPGRPNCKKVQLKMVPMKKMNKLRGPKPSERRRRVR